MLWHMLGNGLASCWAVWGHFRRAAIIHSLNQAASNIPRAIRLILQPGTLGLGMYVSPDGLSD